MCGKSNLDIHLCIVWVYRTDLETEIGLVSREKQFCPSRCPECSRVADTGQSTPFRLHQIQGSELSRAQGADLPWWPGRSSYWPDSLWIVHLQNNCAAGLSRNPFANAFGWCLRFGQCRTLGHYLPRRHTRLDQPEVERVAGRQMDHPRTCSTSNSGDCYIAYLESTRQVRQVHRGELLWHLPGRSHIRQSSSKNANSYFEEGKR